MYRKVPTYIEQRAVCGVFRSFDFDPPPPPHPISTQRVCPSPAPKAGGTHSLGGEGGGAIFRKTPDIGLASYNNLFTSIV